LRYVDSNIIIHHLVKDGCVGPSAQKYLESVAKGDESACSSTYMVIEVYAFLKGMKYSEQKISSILDSVASYGIVLLPLESEIVLKSLPMMKGRWRLGDAIHYNTMLENDITEIVSDDRHFDDVEKISRVDVSTLV